jgi:outer membrane protein with beta-barrel domain
MTMRIAPACVLLAAAIAAPAAAQTGPAPERLHSIGVGVHTAAPYRAGDAPGIQGSWVRWVKPRVGIEAEMRWWTGRRITDSIGPTLRLHDEEKQTSYAVGVSVVARAGAGRLSVLGGIGPGFFADRWNNVTTANGETRSTGSSYSTVGVQGLMEMDVRLTNRASLFAGLRIELRDPGDAESLFGCPTVGVRFAF